MLFVLTADKYRQVCVFYILGILIWQVFYYDPPASIIIFCNF